MNIPSNYTLPQTCQHALIHNKYFYIHFEQAYKAGGYFGPFAANQQVVENLVLRPSPRKDEDSLTFFHHNVRPARTRTRVIINVNAYHARDYASPAHKAGRGSWARQH